MSTRNEWNPNPTKALVMGLYNAFYRHERADAASDKTSKKKRTSKRTSAAPAAPKLTEDRLLNYRPVPLGRAQTNDGAPQLPAPASAALRVDAIRGMVSLYNQGWVTPENLLRIVSDIATDRGQS